MNRSRSVARETAGLTLIELVIVLGVLVILASAIRPAILSQVVDAQSDVTRAEAKAIYEAMVGPGDPRGPFGFVGDMGRLPASFAELVQPAGLPRYTHQTIRNVGMGWKGPYVNVGDSAEDYLSDAFGQPYRGAASGRVVSAGPNGVFGDYDDIAYPPQSPNIVGIVTVVVKTKVEERTVVDPLGVEVRLYYAESGQQAYRSDSAPPFVFPNVPMGDHAVLVLVGGQIVTQETVVAPGQGGSALTELWY